MTQLNLAHHVSEIARDRWAPGLDTITRSTVFKASSYYYPGYLTDGGSARVKAGRERCAMSTQRRSGLRSNIAVAPQWVALHRVLGTKRTQPEQEMPSECMPQDGGCSVFRHEVCCVQNARAAAGDVIMQ